MHILYYTHTQAHTAYMCMYIHMYGIHTHTYMDAPKHAQANKHTCTCAIRSPNYLIPTYTHTYMCPYHSQAHMHPQTCMYTQIVYIEKYTPIHMYGHKHTHSFTHMCTPTHNPHPTHALTHTIPSIARPVRRHPPQFLTGTFSRRSHP